MNNVSLVKIFEIELEKTERKDINQLIKFFVSFDCFCLYLSPAINIYHSTDSDIRHQRMDLTHKNGEFIKEESISKKEYLRLKELIKDKILSLTNEYLNTAYLEFPQAPEELQ